MSQDRGPCPPEILAGLPEADRQTLVEMWRSGTHERVVRQAAREIWALLPESEEVRMRSN